MNALLLTLVVSGGLFAAGLLFFLSMWRRRDFEATDHLALLPFSEEDHVSQPSNARSSDR